MSYLPITIVLFKWFRFGFRRFGVENVVCCKILIKSNAGTRYVNLIFLIKNSSNPYQVYGYPIHDKSQVIIKPYFLNNSKIVICILNVLFRRKILFEMCKN